jgi:hypothetical protein
MNNKTININFDLLKQQRDHLLSHVWHDSKSPPQPIDEEVAWGIIDLMDNLLYEQESKKNQNYR